MTDPVELLRAGVAAAESLRQYADSIGCSAAYISDILRGNRDPGPKVLKALGIDRKVETQITYKRNRK